MGTFGDPALMTSAMADLAHYYPLESIRAGWMIGLAAIIQFIWLAANK